MQKGTARTHSYGYVTETVTPAAQERSLSAMPRWLPTGLAIGSATAAVGLWLGLIARGHPPFAPPAVALGDGLAHQGVPAAEAPEVDLLASQERTVVPDRKSVV